MKKRDTKGNTGQLDEKELVERKNRVLKINTELKKLFPGAKIALHYGSHWELIVAVVLSAQCTDKQVNQVTKTLFEKLPTARAFAGAPVELIEELIRPTGYFRNKARNIKNCAHALVEHHAGEVPDNLEELVKLPGVGRKTANVVLGAAFHIPGIVVDTHVSRISQRLDLTDAKDPVKIEFDLMRQIPKRAWHDFFLHLIYFGRETCQARKPKCPTCPLVKLCEYPNKLF